MRYRVIAAAVVFAGLFLGLTPSAQAQFGSVQQMLFQGLQYAGNQGYWSSPQNGPLYNFNQFRNRIEFDRAGQGYAYESIRFFGPDTYGNTNTVDLGPFKLQLGRDQTLLNNAQPVGIHSKIGYTTTLIPQVYFQAQTGQQTINQFSGVTTFAPTPLHYTATLTTGVQDFTWEGNALIDGQGSLNAMGFYDVKFRFTNVGDYTADGVLVHDEQVTDFDLGPIDVSGNIGLDMLSGLLQNNGSTAAAVPSRVVSGATKDKRTEDLLTRLHAGEQLGESDMQYLAQKMFETALANDPFGVLANGMPSTVPGFEGVTFDMTTTPQEGVAPNTTVPEPGTLAVLALAFGLSAGLRSLRFRRSSSDRRR
jgi:hypothetical protein